MSTSGANDPGKTRPLPCNAPASLAALLESTSDLIWAVDLDYSLVTFNPAFAQDIALSYRVSVTLGMRPNEIFPAEEAASLSSSYERALAEGRFVTEFESRTGRILELTCHPIHQDGSTTGVSVFGKDITKRKTTEKSLQSWYRATFEGAVLGIFRFGPDRRLAAANPALAEILGYDSPQEMIATITPDRFWADADGAAQLARQVAEQEFVRGYECRVKRKDGTPIWVSLSSQRVYGPDGKMSYYQGFLEDITQRKRTDEALRATERELREREEFQRMLLDASPAFIVAMDASFRVLMMNRSLLEALEYAPEEVQGKEYIGTFVPEAARPSLREATQRMLDLDLGYVQDESRIVSRSGRERLVAWRARRVFAENGEMKFFVAVGVDTTELREVEQQFRQAQKMEAIGRLAGGVAHDFNNLLTVINGYSELVLSRVSAEDSLRSSIAEIRKAGERAAALCRQLLLVSRKQVVEPRPVDLGNSIANAHGMLERLLGEDVELLVDVAADAGKVMADPGQLDQVLMNLVVNARDAMPEGGQLRLRTFRMNLDPLMVGAPADVAPGAYMVLEVSDTGLGMSKETQQKMFEPFFTTKGDTGTGLGLATVYGIVHQAGGWIQVESELGKGTTFRIGLPLWVEALPTNLSRQGPPPELKGGETILVVEDREDVRKVTLMSLQSFGYRTLEAESGEGALKIIQESAGSIDLMLTDLVMPRMNGRQLAEQVRSLHPGIKILYMTGYAADVISRHGLSEDGADGTEYIQKPFTPEALARKLRILLGKASRGGKVLIIDDDPGICGLFAAVLQGNGYQVTTRCDATEAQRTLSTESFDLVLTDLAMPNAEGIDVVRTVRETHAGMKVLAVSGVFGESCLSIARSVGADATLQKPISPNELLSVVRDLLAR